MLVQIFPKIDEMSLLLSINPVDVAAIAESWLHEDIDIDNLLYISGFNLVRKR